MNILESIRSLALGGISQVQQRTKQDKPKETMNHANVSPTNTL